jgi:hypothetical protein
MRSMTCTHDFRVASVILLAALAPSALASNTWYVDDDGSPFGDGSFANPFSSIQRAISGPGTTSGDTIRVRPGLYRERLDFGNSVLVIGEAGPDETVIDAEYRGSVVTIRNRGNSESRLEGFTLANGTGRYNPIRGESLGGGLFCVNSRVALVDCHITTNATRTGGPDSPLLGRGGGVYAGVRANIVLQDCLVANNEAVDGGGLYVDRGKVAVLGGSVQDNHALGGVHAGRGGGMLAGDGAQLELTGVLVQANLAFDFSSSYEALGGGIRLESGSRAVVADCLIEANECRDAGHFVGYGGAISSMAHADDFRMTGTWVRGNKAAFGGALHGRGRLERCTIENNIIAYGGGAGVAASDVTLLDCVVRSNSSFEAYGGGIYVFPGGSARLERCEVALNYARPQGGGGWGGVYVDCDIHDNHAGGDGTDPIAGGGGVFRGDLIDCRVWNNRADDSEDHHALGGGLYGGTALRTVFHHNSADLGGGGAAWSALERCTVVFNDDGVLDCTVHDGIVRFNTWYDVGASSASWSNVPAGVPGAGNISGDPLFVNAAANDYRLLTGSPCIDAGDPTSPPDPDGSRADMGALRFGS